MSFHRTPVRRLCFIRAGGFFLLALAIGLLPFFVEEVDAEGRVFAAVMAGFCLLVAIYNLWQARRTSPEETVTSNPELAPVSEQTPYYRRMLWLSLVAFPIATAWIAYDLHQLESGAAERVRIWAPISLIYEHFGYWAAVLSVPALGLACGLTFRHKLRQLGADGSSGNA